MIELSQKNAATSTHQHFDTDHSNAIILTFCLLYICLLGVYSYANKIEKPSMVKSEIISFYLIQKRLDENENTLCKFYVIKIGHKKHPFDMGDFSMFMIVLQYC